MGEKKNCMHNRQWGEEQWKNIIFKASISIHLEQGYTGALFQWFQVICFRIISNFDVDVIAHHA